MTITEIKRKSHSKNIYQIYIDNKFWAEMLDETVVKFDLKTGKVLDEKTMEEILTFSKPPLAMHLCLNLLDRSSKTKKEILEYLLVKGISSEVADNVAKKLEDYGYIDDQKYAENFVLYKKNKGKKALRFELKMKGVDEEIINGVLEKIESQKDVIFTLAQKFLNNKKPAPDLKQKLFRHLASKGFEFEEINLVITEIFKEQK
ncbi:MAG: RecX family transcriptional regulator [Clostridia bacterium]|nr:RecX family transcriptional regulator [Clostridia bacterium]